MTVDKEASGFRITKSALSLSASVAGLSEPEFQRIAAAAKANCPVSKLLNAEITLAAELKA